MGDRVLTSIALLFWRNTATILKFVALSLRVYYLLVMKTLANHNASKARIRVIVIMYFLLVLLSSCNRRNAEEKRAINLNDLNTYIDTLRATCHFPEPDFASCNDPKDVLIQNLPYTYDEAIKILGQKFTEIDSQQSDRRTRQLAKTLVCADFVYASFSYRYLGDVIGINNDTSLAGKWDSLPLSVCYELGNKNFKAVYCEERARFFLRLVKKLLDIDGHMVSIPGAHSFPVVLVKGDGDKGKPYLVDPFDPFIVVRKGSKELLYFGPSQSSPDELEIHRSKRVFGDTRVLVSKPLLEALEKQGYASGYCSLLSFTQKLKNDYSRSMGGLDSMVVNLPDFKRSFLLPGNSRFKYAIELSGRPDGQLFDSRSYLKYYGR